MVVQEWPRGVKIKVRSPKGEKTRPAKRGRVSEFSPDAARRLGWAYSQGPWRGMLTLTYPGGEPVTYEEFACHRHRILLHLKARGIRYLWVLEWQRRGVPHLHIWVDRDMETETVTTETVRQKLSDRIRQTEFVRQKMTDKKCPQWKDAICQWLRIIGANDNEKAVKVGLHPMSWCAWEVRVGNNYAAKYANKREQKGLPTGIEHFGRWWGVSRGTIQPSYATEVDEEVVNVKTGEVVRSVSIRRQLHRALRAWFPNRKKHKKNSQSGLTVALREGYKAEILRILAYYLGPDPMQTQKTKSPDQESWAYRSQRSLARHLQMKRESEKGADRK